MVLVIASFSHVLHFLCISSSVLNSSMKHFWGQSSSQYLWSSMLLFFFFFENRMSLNCLVLSPYDSGLLGQIWEVRRPPLSPCLTLRTHPVEDEDPQGGEPRSRETSSLYCHPPESSEVKTSFTTLLFEESRIWGQHPVGCNSALDLWGGPAANPPPMCFTQFPKVRFWGFLDFSRRTPAPEVKGQDTSRHSRPLFSHSLASWLLPWATHETGLEQSTSLNPTFIPS